MAYLPLTGIIDHLRSLAINSDTACLDDRQLLERFLNRHDQAAFESLLYRHGPMVLGVCRRYLPDMHQAEDAFQATFLVLLRKARSLRKRELLANWLYGVAYRTAMKARTDSARRRKHEREKHASPNRTTAESCPAFQEDRAALHEEVRRLSTKYRLPIVLCYFEGLTLKEAAQQLGWPVGTVSGRLARARQLLGARLTRRGVSLLAGGLSLMLEETSRAAVPTALISATAQAAVILTAKPAAGAAIISSSVLALTQGVVKVMFLSKLKLAALVMSVIGLSVGTGVGIYARQSSRAAKDVPGAQTAPAPESSRNPPPGSQEGLVHEPGLPPRPIQKSVEQYLPEFLALTANEGMPAAGEKNINALVAKLKANDKTKSLLKAQYEAALGVARARWKEFMLGRGTLSFLLSSSERLLEAERALSDQKADHVTALENQWKRMREVEKVNDERFRYGRISVSEALDSRFYRLQAEIRLERAKADLGKEGP
jgi:RNA polymerase sigma factor (sigma-70 family)